MEKKRKKTKEKIIVEKWKKINTLKNNGPYLLKVDRIEKVIYLTLFYTVKDLTFF